MATSIKEGELNLEGLPSALGMRIGIVVAEWHDEITGALLEGARTTLLKLGAKPDDIIVRYVPGTFELTAGSKYFAVYTDVDAVIVIGCVVRGETPHFDYVCQSVTHGITELNLRYTIPFIFGVLTTDTYEQSKDRAGGKYGNKGDELAIAAVKMVVLEQTFEEDFDLDDFNEDGDEYDVNDFLDDQED